MAIAQVIKYEGGNDTFIWKHPLEDFDNSTQLIVHESQEAIFFMNGQALDLFGAGRYTLQTQNIPKIGHFLRKNTDSDVPFHAEVYFINKAVQMAIKWGTDSKIRFVEPTMGVPFEIGACGEMNLAVSDSRKLLLKLVGTTNGIAWGDNGNGFTKSLQACFRPLISTAVKTHLSAGIKSENIDLFEIDEHLDTLGKRLQAAIAPEFEEYGLTIPQFYLTTVLLPEDDINFKRMKELHTLSLHQNMIKAEAAVRSAQAEADASVTAAQRQVTLEQQTTQTEIAKREAERQIIAAQAAAQAYKMQGVAEADVMAAKGYNQRDVLAADVQKAYAEGIGNMTVNGGGVVGDIVGLGVGVAAAGAVAPQLGEMFKGATPSANATSATGKKCAKCGAALSDNAKFCPECGEKVAPALPDNMIVCPSCGKEVASGAKFCPECGEKLQ